MRLIDADALKDGYMNMGYDPNEHPEESYMEGWCKGFNAAVDHCIGHVIYAPTIEQETEEEAYERGYTAGQMAGLRKTGKWILVTNGNGQHYVCHNCGQWRYHQGQKFCSECGLKMEEGEQE